jgi:CHAT domain-containing protein
MPPAAVCDIHKFQVFASRYTESSTRQRELPEAMEEQRMLLAAYADWNTGEYRAREDDLIRAIDEKTQGKAAHFAVHGMADPGNNRQHLILEDQRLPADALIGAYSCGDPPMFSFVFMNACQLGVPGKNVDREVGGFPGELLRGGAYGVIAPLWDVHDDVAQECAMAFYKAVFREGKSVAEALRERRATYTRDSSTTPVAYVFYGHPGLKLRKA